jgi:hypothetical protein
MEKIIIQKQTEKQLSTDTVHCVISRDVSELIDEISDATGISKRRIMDLLLRKAAAAVEIVEPEV